MVVWEWAIAAQLGGMFVLVGWERGGRREVEVGRGEMGGGREEVRKGRDGRGFDGGLGR